MEGGRENMRTKGPVRKVKTFIKGGAEAAADRRAAEEER